MVRSHSLVGFSTNYIERPMASFPVGLVETRASGRPTSAPPADMGDFLMMPEVALTSDTLYVHFNDVCIKLPDLA